MSLWFTFVVSVLVFTGVRFSHFFLNDKIVKDGFVLVNALMFGNR